MKLRYSCLMVGSRVQTLVFPWILEQQIRHRALSCCAECKSSGGGWRTLNERRLHRRWRTARRWLAHCLGSPLIICGANIPLAVHTGKSSLPRPFAIVINKNIILVIMDLWRSAKLLANLWWQIELSIRSLTLLAWPTFSLYYYSLLFRQVFASLLDSILYFLPFYSV
jgi:hypothetical protein